MRSISLRTKFLGITIGLIVVLGLAVMIFIQTVLTQELTAELQKRGLVIAKDVAEESIDPILTRDMFALQTIAVEHKEFEKDIVYVFILDHKDEVLAHTFGERFPTDLREANIVRPNQAYSIQSLITEKGAICDIAVPLLSGEAGVVHLGILEEPVRRKVANIVRLIFGIVIGVLILGSGVAIIFVGAITKPVSKLVEVAMAVGGGDLEQKAHIKTGDEIGRLGTVFNKMIEDLKKTTVSRDELMQETTERKKTEERIKRQKDFMTKIIESLTHPFYVIDANNYTLKMANSAARFGPLSEVSTCYELTHKRDKPCMDEHICPLEEVKKTKKPAVVEHIHYDKGGNARNVEVHGYPIFDERGDVVQMIEYSLDITARKRAEEELKEAYVELKETQAQLVQSEKLAAIGQLAAGAAHEINNPLTAISGEAQMLMKDKDKDRDTKDASKIIVEQAKRIKAITERLLEFSQKRKFEEKPLDINEAVKESISLLAYQAKTEDMKIIKGLGPNLPKIIGDKNQLQEVFFNIMLNAVQAMENGGTLTVRTRGEEITKYGNRKTDVFKQGQEIVVIEFKDTGRGMDDEVLEKLFDPFFTTKEKNTGLGLSISYGIIRNHNGLIEAHSKLGEGSTFIVKLPIMGGKNEKEDFGSR